jgi:hypothetical protein
MADERSYEIQTFVNGDWKIQAFFDDKDLALLEAKRMVQSRRYPALRVTEEYWDDRNEVFRSRTIYRDNEVDRHNQQVAEKRAEVRREAEESRERRQARREQNKKTKQSNQQAFGQTYVGLAVKGLGIFALGVAAIYLLNVLAGG